MTYVPAPIDTSGIDLSPDIEALTERLAENAHDLWAQQRIADGWKHGPRRDDTLKEHPCLISYAELPEAEKRYDRTAATETLKTIIAMGYRVSK